jgi:hypothetical protein
VGVPRVPSAVEFSAPTAPRLSGPPATKTQLYAPAACMQTVRRINQSEMRTLKGIASSGKEAEKGL